MGNTGVNFVLKCTDQPGIQISGLRITGFRISGLPITGFRITEGPLLNKFLVKVKIQQYKRPTRCNTNKFY